MNYALLKAAQGTQASPTILSTWMPSTHQGGGGGCIFLNWEAKNEEWIKNWIKKL